MHFCLRVFPIDGSESTMVKEFRFMCSNGTHSLYASVIVGDEGEEFLSEQGDQRGRRLWQSQHLLQYSQHLLPTKTKRKPKSD